jgi:hypothetical protein
MIGLMAFLWMAQAAHCQIETVRGLEFLTCASSGNAENAAHSCCGGTCKTIESRQNKTEDKKRLAAAQPAPQPWLTVALVTLVLLESDSDRGNSFADVPPEFSKCWQFLSRTALPVRAPSFAS